MKTNRLFLLALILLFIFPAAEAKTYLVSIGVSDYSHYPYRAMSLRLPIQDAKVVADIYSINRTKKKNNGSIDYVLLLDSLATKDRIIRAMNKVYTQAGEDDIVVFFFSGHGYNGGFCAFDGDLEYKDIRKVMSKSKSKNKVIFADACRSGGLRGENSSVLADEDSVDKKANVMLLLSSRTKENSIERSDMKNGFFTEFLKRGLSGNADANRDRTITAKELFDFVSKGVAEISYDKQHPVMWGNFNDNMPVMKW